MPWVNVRLYVLLPSRRKLNLWLKYEPYIYYWDDVKLRVKKHKQGQHFISKRNFIGYVAGGGAYF